MSISLPKHVIRAYQEYLEYLIHKELYGEFESLSRKSKQRDGQQGEKTELSCEEVRKIQGTVYWVIGDNLIKYIKTIEQRLRHPAIYFQSGECEDMLRGMGITEPGVYLIKNGQLVRKIKKFDLWFKKHLLRS